MFTPIGDRSFGSLFSVCPSEDEGVFCFHRIAYCDVRIVALVCVRLVEAQCIAPLHAFIHGMRYLTNILAVWLQSPGACLLTARTCPSYLLPTSRGAIILPPEELALTRSSRELATSLR